MHDRLHLARVIRRATADCPPVEVPRRLCEALSRGLPVDAVTMSLLTDTPSRQLLCASNEMARVLEEVQFTVMEGPCIEAASTGEPVHATDLPAAAGRWPLFVAALHERCPDVAAVHAFPLWFGDYVLGSVDFACRAPGGMPADAVEQAAEAAEAAALALLPTQRMLLEDDDYPSWEPSDVVRAHWSDTHQAVSVVAARKRTSVATALALMRARAFATGRTLAEVTADILGS
ncbi:GAF domain-containing protein [Actinacidiphila paucisporea]|uniref:GAF domain-containing protein n=1 Tax=Actinacidiphila paucisporea TaxID=310782 RepID=A0A1M7LQF9_9ACTN|nr:GAF domain-containing protein [Actinacidiphila paucisporea]SHM80479.1 GAF domain-containing protein [Actinacidiphila paucisporea]